MLGIGTASFFVFETKKIQWIARSNTQKNNPFYFNTCSNLKLNWLNSCHKKNSYFNKDKSNSFYLILGFNSISFSQYDKKNIPYFPSRTS